MHADERNGIKRRLTGKSVARVNPPSRVTLCESWSGSAHLDRRLTSWTKKPTVKHGKQEGSHNERAPDDWNPHRGKKSRKDEPVERRPAHRSANPGDAAHLWRLRYCQKGPC